MNIKELEKTPADRLNYEDMIAKIRSGEITIQGMTVHAIDHGEIYALIRVKDIIFEKPEKCISGHLYLELSKLDVNIIASPGADFIHRYFTASEIKYIDGHLFIDNSFANFCCGSIEGCDY